ncbi:Eukaryotic translation initiation factor 3 subunit M [Hypsizygus marmoreus]|uniref:Eukaryotic translation initiation factor 3 subunit M n=1 Tax=Hypsizygus marmoreus TaxID=39966 RepID=A0A369JCP1_HYPMA|nr:Eukaryotic translation initiation factor 3 subunit M [Hypsizygus marmoreus]
MTGTDSVSVFAEGTFEEQIQELVNYIVRNRSEEERAAFIRPFQDALKTEEGQKTLEEDADRRKRIFSMALVEVKGLGDGSDREIEGFFNLIYSHLFTLYALETPEAKETLTTLLQTISSAPSNRQPVKYRILSNLFNAIPRTSPLRLAVYNTLLEIASSTDDLETLQLTRGDVEKWLSEWDISPAEKSAFLKTIVDAFEKADKPETAYEYSRVYVRSLPPTSPEAQEAAVSLIATALRLPTVFDFDPLFKLDAVVAAKDNELFPLLQIFLNDNLPEFKAWEESHQGALEKYNLDSAQLERKIRLLTLASLAFKHVGHDVPYSKVAEALQVDSADVEKWAIDVIRAGLVWGKLSQTTQSLHITRATARTFEKEQWEVLEKRLQAWKSGLNGVLEVVVNAKRQAGLGQPANAA